MDRDRDGREVEAKLKHVACHIIEHAAKMAEAAPDGLGLEISVPRFGLPFIGVNYDVRCAGNDAQEQIMPKSGRLDLQQLIRHMVGATDKSYADVSRELGHARSYVNVMLRDKTTPGLDLFVKIANACGYDVLVVGHGEAHRLAAERIGDAKVSATRLWSVESASVDGASVDRLTLEPVEAQDASPG